MNDPEKILRDALGPLLRGALEGPAERRLGHLERAIVLARALMRFAREVAPVVAPGSDREAVLRFTARALAPAAREVISKAGLDAEQGQVLIAALALGLEAGAAEAGRPVPPDEADRVGSLARLLEFAQGLRGRGYDRDGLRDRLAQFARGEVDAQAEPSTRAEQEALALVAVDAIVSSFFPLAAP